MVNFQFSELRDILGTIKSLVPLWMVDITWSWLHSISLDPGGVGENEGCLVHPAKENLFQLKFSDPAVTSNLLLG